MMLDTKLSPIQYACAPAVSTAPLTACARPMGMLRRRHRSVHPTRIEARSWVPRHGYQLLQLIASDRYLTSTHHTKASELGIPESHTRHQCTDDGQS